MSERTERIRELVRDIPDFPKPGVLFRDITPLVGSRSGFQDVIAALLESAPGQIDMVAAIEARGFIFGAPLAVAMNVGFVPIRKPGKLPFATYVAEYDLEYDTSSVQMHIDALKPGQRVLIIDDLLATGGTLIAAAALVLQAGGEVAGVSTVLELKDLGGRAKIHEAGIDQVNSILEL
jgi:adenine phosphoribosyltransferase